MGSVSGDLRVLLGLYGDGALLSITHRSKVQWKIGSEIGNVLP